MRFPLFYTAARSSRTLPCFGLHLWIRRPLVRTRVWVQVNKFRKGSSGSDKDPRTICPLVHRGTFRRSQNCCSYVYVLEQDEVTESPTVTMMIIGRPSPGFAAKSIFIEYSNVHYTTFESFIFLQHTTYVHRVQLACDADSSGSQLKNDSPKAFVTVTSRWLEEIQVRSDRQEMLRIVYLLLLGAGRADHSAICPKHNRCICVPLPSSTPKGVRITRNEVSYFDT